MSILRTLTPEERDRIYHSIDFHSHDDSGWPEEVEKVIADRLAARDAEHTATLDALAKNIEWEFRTATFSCSTGTSEVRLHPAGERIRQVAAQITGRDA